VIGKWLRVAGAIALLLGVMGFGSVYADVRDQRAKEAAIAAQLRAPDPADGKVGLSDLFQLARMREGTRAVAYLASALFLAGVVCLLAAFAVGGGRTAP